MIIHVLFVTLPRAWQIFVLRMTAKWNKEVTQCIKNPWEESSCSASLWIPHVYGTRIFTPVFTRARQLSLPRPTSLQDSTLINIYFHIIIPCMSTPFKVCLVVPPTKSWHALFSSKLRSTHHHPIVLDLITLIKWRSYTFYCGRINYLKVVLSLINDLLQRV